MATNWHKLFAMKKQAEAKLNKMLPDLTNECGIYIFTRDDESGLKMCYIGQAKHLKDRLSAHLIGYQQRIDISLKKRGFYDEVKRPYGWKLDIIHTLEKELDDYEEMKIKEYALKGYQLYNRTGGKQGKGKVGINDAQSNKGYREGVIYGKKLMLREIKEYFDKYLEFRIKRSQEALRKPKNKAEERGDYGILFKEIYIKKYIEFKNLLEGDNDDGEGTN